MAIKSATFHWAVCDRCGARVEGEYGDGMVHEEPRQADDAATDQDWWVEDGHHVCEECIPHGPDWDEMHEAMSAGEIDTLICQWCSNRAEEKK